jgi:hypothetical protein
LQGFFAKNISMQGYFAPSHYRHIIKGKDFFHQSQAHTPHGRLQGGENHRYGDTARRITQQLKRDVGHKTTAIAAFQVYMAAASMLLAGQGLETVLEEGVAGLLLSAGNQAYAAGGMFGGLHHKIKMVL